MPKNDSERNGRNLDNIIFGTADGTPFFSLYSEKDGDGCPGEDDSAEEISVPTPREIKAYLDRSVIGQEQAKKVLSVAAYNHVKRIGDDSGLIRKSNILMVGPSGCGKTLLAETLAGLLKLPMVTVDATSLTESGYSGNCVETILTRLYQQAGERKALAERGIIFVDEIDKLACRGLNQQREAYCRGVQQGLLKIIEGGRISAPVSLESKNRRTVIDTKNILFICGGAFAGLDELEEEEEGFYEPPRRIGFTAEYTEPPARGTGASARRRLSPDLQVRYGLTQEFVGRLPVLIRLDPLGVEDMVRIISQTEGCLVKEYQQLLARDGVKLRFSPAALRAMAEQALKRNVGARGLRAMMEELLTDIMFEAPDGDRKGKKYKVREIP
ncbi:MAG: AAA family ATPase [Lachnospiraceae bacterium]|nr:AAA family ATPase [Lachnospiraceae bacterium]